MGGGDGHRFGKGGRKGRKGRSGSPSGGGGSMRSPAGRRPRPPKGVPNGPVLGPDGEPLRPAEPPRGEGRDDLSVLEEASDPLDEMGTVEAKAMRRALGEGGEMMASSHSMGSMASTIATREEGEEDGEGDGEGEVMARAMGDTGVMLK